MSAKMSGELFYLLEKYRKSPSEDSLNQLETKLVAVGVPHEQIKSQLADLAASIETTTIDEEASTSEILGWQADANIENCNLAVYRAIAPIAKLMYAVEQNGVAIEHAYKLAVLFDDEKKALAYLSSFIKSNPKVTQPLHDACLFSLPTGQLDLTIWRKLCSKHMNDEFFRHKILPRADVLEAYIKSHQKGKKIDFKSIAEQRQIIEKINAERKKLKRKHGTLTIPEKERLKSLSQQLIAAQKALVTLSPPFNHDLHLTTLQAFLKIKDVESVGTLKYFLENGLTEKDYAEFIALERKDDASQIPNIAINGDEIGHPGFYLMKVDVMDDMQAARAACLGKLSGCCQSLSGEAGESCAIHGLTSPLGGFYVVCKGDVNNPQVSDPLLGQCWAWRSQSGAIVFDSIEAPIVVKNTIDSTKRVAEFYQALAVKLVNDNHTNKVACGARSGISGKVGTQSVCNTKENFVDYAGYCDSDRQRVIADKERPYYGYEVDEQRTHETEKMMSTFVRDEVVSQQSFEMLNWALLFNNNLTTKIENELQTEAQLEKLTMLKKMATLLSNKWNKQIIQHAAEENEKNSLWTSIRNHEGMTPLLWAVQNGHLDLVNMLLANNADVNAKDIDGNTPLWLAAVNRKFDVVNILLTDNADVNAKNKDGDTLLLLMLRDDHNEIAKSLLIKGADVNARDRHDNTPLLLAACSKKPDLVLINLLLANNADVFAKDEYGNTALKLAKDSGNDKIGKVLRAKIKDLSQNQMNSSSAKPKPMAYSYQNETEAVKFMRAVINIKDNEGGTALMDAAKMGHIEEVLALLKKGAKLNIKDNSGMTALMYATKNGHTDLAEKLIEEGAKIDERDNIGDTPLIMAAENRHSDTCLMLIDKGADITIKNNEGETALTAAGFNRLSEVMLRLIKNGADVNASVWGMPVLMLAVKNNLKEVVLLLIEKGADPNVEDRNGKTAFDFASNDLMHAMHHKIKELALPPKEQPILKKLK